jgi:glyoxylase-like metal-dependent hydrolase (beta-lactamase superfamily II)
MALILTLISGGDRARPSKQPVTPESLLHYTHTALPGPGDSLEVADGLFWVRMPLPFALDHINLWLLRDGARWVAVDCGLGTEATRELWQRVFDRRLGASPLSRVIVTHHHPDHVGNAGWLSARSGVPLWMPQAEYLTAHANLEGVAGFGREPLVAMYRRNGLDQCIADKMLTGRMNYRTHVTGFPASYHRIMEGDALVIGACSWRVIMGYGHAPEHAALYCETLGVLISGDMVLPRISTNVSVPGSQPTADPLGQYLDSIRRYAELQPETLVLPSHGLPFRGLRERVAQLQEHHRLRLAQLLEVCGTPKSAADVLATLFRRKLDTHQMFFAMGESMAHMHYLYEQGELERLDGDILRYVRP